MIAGLLASKQLSPGWGGWLDSWHFAQPDFAWISGAAGTVVGIALVLAVSGMLYRAGRSAPVVPAEPPST